MSGRIREGSSTTATDLAKTAPFRLGPLCVEPAARAIVSGGHTEILEPRAMRVLVALGELPGLVLTRDDLIELCWDGQVVSDNAINRVIFLLRRAFEKLSDGAVRLETITKVGFRVVVNGSEQTGTESSQTAPAEAVEPDAPVPTAPPRKWTRRAAIAGAALTCTALVYAAATWTRRARPDARARDLYERGQFLIRTGELGSVRQAIDFYKQAVKIDPDYADAWGALAIGYIHDLDSMFSFREKSAAPNLVRSAAERALSLDPDQPDAQLALAIPFPHFRRWLDHERRLRDVVRRYPDYWYGHAQLGTLLLNVGRSEGAAERFRRVLEIEPMLPNYWARFALALHFAGREQEADIAFDEASSRWPTSMALRLSRGRSYVDSRRYAEAVAHLREARNTHEGAPPGARERGLRMVEALASGTGFAEHIRFFRGAMSHDIGSDLTSPGMHLLWLGETDLAFDAIEATYLGGTVEGRRIAPPVPTDRRSTVALFSTTMLAWRDHPRYAGILERTGLEDYWRKSGTQPDFRKS